MKERDLSGGIGNVNLNKGALSFYVCKFLIIFILLIIWKYTFKKLPTKAKKCMFLGVFPETIQMLGYGLGDICDIWDV